MNYFEKRKIRKQLKAVLHHARTLRCSREDIMSADDLESLDEHVARAREAYAAREGEAMEDAGKCAETRITRINPPAVCRLARI